MFLRRKNTLILYAALITMPLLSFRMHGRRSPHQETSWSARRAIPCPPVPGTGLSPTQLTAGAANRFDEGSFADLLPNQERDSFFLDARQEFGKLDLWYQGWLSERDFDERVAPASGQLRVPNTNAFFVAPAALGSPAFVNVEYRFLAEDADPRLSGYENAHAERASARATTWAATGASKATRISARIAASSVVARSPMAPH